MIKNETQPQEQEKFPVIDFVEQIGIAEGNLKFLAQADLATFTQGEAALKALHAVQQASKLFNQLQRKHGFQLWEK